MKMVKKSLARQLTATIVALVAGTVLLCWFLPTISRRLCLMVLPSLTVQANRGF